MEKAVRQRIREAHATWSVLTVRGAWIDPVCVGEYLRQFEESDKKASQTLTEELLFMANDLWKEFTVAVGGVLHYGRCLNCLVHRRIRKRILVMVKAAEVLARPLRQTVDRFSDIGGGTTAQNLPEPIADDESV
ncbi:hypothetical protein M513_09420 [Trichuris suis]|uniref:Uncharacterized protein n=1 Tax=Trichuris suis TaxID=68888 RepID=A0A085LXM7_9BILA|nr:hypothetical protein M513_09420 [Trichuris suis]